jgi:Outer membrane protein beta-barrel domain
MTRMDWPVKALRTTVLLGALLTSVSAGAQTYFYATPEGSLGFYGSLLYQLGLPVGATHGYISDVEWRGVGVDLGWMVRPNVSIGVALGWNVFYENTTGTVTSVPGNKSPGFAIYGNQDRSFNFFPLLVDFRYAPRLKDGLRPFFGVGIGGYVTTEYLGIGLTSYTQTAFQLGVAPEVGFLVPVEGGAAVQFSARYNLAFPAGGVDFQQWLGLSLGLAWGAGL